MKVKVKFEKDIEDCYCCPLKETVREMGSTFDVCRMLDGYDAIIPHEGIHKSCPFREENKKTIDNK